MLKPFQSKTATSIVVAPVYVLGIAHINVGRVARANIFHVMFQVMITGDFDI